MLNSIKRIILLLSVVMLTVNASAQAIAEQDTTITPERKGAVSELKYIKQAGFANASSKIFSADRRFTISGFGELNFVNYQHQVPNKEGKEMEQFYTNLTRFGTYFGYRLTDKIVFMSEIQMEYLQDGFFSSKGHFEYNIEASVDFLLHPLFNVRVGNFPLSLGWVNVNEEPIGFYSVNRPEVERTIIPTQWLEQGVMFYGSPFADTEYQFGVTKGLDATNFTSGTWIRDGRYTSWTEIPPSLALNGKLGYGHEDKTLISVAGYYGDASRAYEFENGDKLNSNLGLLTVVGAHNIGNFTLFGLYAHGWLSGTDQLFDINQEVLGSQTQGYYIEGRYDILPHIMNGTEWKLPLFVRYERMNTHYKIDDDVYARWEAINDPTLARADLKDLEVVTVGLNFRPKKNWTFKANYQFRTNKYVDSAKEPNQFELGIGFIF